MPALQERSVAQGMLDQGHSQLKAGRGWVDGGLPGSREMGLAAGRDLGQERHLHGRGTLPTNKTSAALQK